MMGKAFEIEGVEWIMNRYFSTLYLPILILDHDLRTLLPIA
jgi:hypothetical protein